MSDPREEVEKAKESRRLIQQLEQAEVRQRRVQKQRAKAARLRNKKDRYVSSTKVNVPLKDLKPTPTLIPGKPIKLPKAKTPKPDTRTRYKKQVDSQADFVAKLVNADVVNKDQARINLPC